MKTKRINFSNGIEICHVDAPVGKDGKCHLMQWLCDIEMLRTRNEPHISFLINDYENMAKMYVQGLRDCEAIDDEGLKSLFSLIEGDGEVIDCVKM
jgi:hypothetical protein